MMWWETVTDEEMRAAVLACLQVKLTEASRSAASRNQSSLAPSEHLAWTSYSRRQAAHYQQAIDLLAAAPMPEKEGT